MRWRQPRRLAGEKKDDEMETGAAAAEKINEIETAPTEKNKQNDEMMADEGPHPAGKKEKSYGQGEGVET